MKRKTVSAIVLYCLVMIAGVIRTVFLYLIGNNRIVDIDLEEYFFAQYLVTFIIFALLGAIFRRMLTVFERPLLVMLGFPITACVGTSLGLLCTGDIFSLFATLLSDFLFFAAVPLWDVLKKLWSYSGIKVEISKNRSDVVARIVSPCLLGVAASGVLIGTAWIWGASSSFQIFVHFLLAFLICGYEPFKKRSFHTVVTSAAMFLCFAAAAYGWYRYYSAVTNAEEKLKSYLFAAFVIASMIYVLWAEVIAVVGRVFEKKPIGQEAPSLAKDPV